MICKYWIELDDSEGMPFEFCRAVHKRCRCSGVEHQCTYGCFEERPLYDMKKAIDNLLESMF